MQAPTKTKRRKQRELLEQFAVGAGARTSEPALKIDRDAGVIFGVKVLGRFSKNSHGLTEAENGTEYSPSCMKEALPMYEELKVKCNHPPDRSKPSAERDVDDTFGLLRNARIESEEDGIRADLHYFKSHPMAERVLEDIERRLGVWGLSHNAAAKRERFDSAKKRLVIESLQAVRSADLVDKPATNRNLWESEESSGKTMSTTLRELLESRRPNLSKPRRKWADRLLEDDAMATTMDAPMDATEEGGDEDDVLWDGFCQACMKILNGDGTAAEKGKKITNYLKAHEKLTQSDEPEEPPAGDAKESEEDDDASDDKKKLEKQESEELTTLRSERAARVLCESLSLANPTTVQIAAVAGVKDDKQKRELIESFKTQPSTPTKPGTKTPKSAPPGGNKPPAEKKPRDVQESEETKKASVADDLATLRHGG